jgi:hypothetical protein
MANPFFSGRIPPGLADKIDAHLLTTGETRSELLIRLLRVEIADNKLDNNLDNHSDNVLLDLIARVERLEQTVNNKSDNTVDPIIDNKIDNILSGLTFHADDDKLDNTEKLVTTDNKSDDTQPNVLQDHSQSVDLTPTQLADLKKIRDRQKVTKAKSNKLLDLGVIIQMGEDLILTKLGQAALDEVEI